MISIVRKLEFDAGHRVLRHESKCRHLHGHRYVVDVTVTAPDLDPLGRVVDFSVIKDEVGGWINTHLDHNLILHPEDPLLQFLDREVLTTMGRPTIVEDDFEVFGGRRPFVMPAQYANPTAENLAYMLLGICGTLLPAPLRTTSVCVHETPNCSATAFLVEEYKQVDFTPAL